jgi:hypothetical protein
MKTNRDGSGTRFFPFFSDRVEREARHAKTVRVEGHVSLKMEREGKKTNWDPFEEASRPPRRM